MKKQNLSRAFVALSMLAMTTSCGTSATDDDADNDYTTAALATSEGQVAWTEPAGGATVRGTLSLRVSAPASTRRVLFYLDGSRVGRDTDGAPWTATVDTRAFSAGSHTLKAVAKDRWNSVLGHASISVTIDQNTTPPAPVDSGVVVDSGVGSAIDSGVSPAVDSGVGSVIDSGTTAPSSWWRPRPGVRWQWQLTGTIDTTVDAQMFDIDLFDTPQSTIDRLHASGRTVICYFSAGSREDWRPDAGQFPSSALGNALQGWAGERWLDTRNATVRSIMSARLDLARSKHCDGVEPDNVDGYTNSPGFPLTASTQIDYNRFLAREAHARGLSVGLKNDVDQVAQLVADFDFAINEECFRYNECGTLQPFIDAGKAVFQVEYGGQSRADAICPQANARNFDSLVKQLDLDAWRISCR